MGLKNTAWLINQGDFWCSWYSSKYLSKRLIIITICGSHIGWALYHLKHKCGESSIIISSSNKESFMPSIRGWHSQLDLAHFFLWAGCPLNTQVLKPAMLRLQRWAIINCTKGSRPSSNNDKSFCYLYYSYIHSRNKCFRHKYRAL